MRKRKSDLCKTNVREKTAVRGIGGDDVAEANWPSIAVHETTPSLFSPLTSHMADIDNMERQRVIREAKQEDEWEQRARAIERQEATVHHLKVEEEKRQREKRLFQDKVSAIASLYTLPYTFYCCRFNGHRLSQLNGTEVPEPQIITK